MNELWTQTYPHDVLPIHNLYLIYFGLGQYDKLLEDANYGLRISPDGFSYSGLVVAYGSLNRLEEARAKGEEALKKNLDSETLRTWLYILAFLRNDEAGMRAQVAWATGRPGVESDFLKIAGYPALSRVLDKTAPIFPE